MKSKCVKLAKHNLLNSAHMIIRERVNHIDNCRFPFFSASNAYVSVNIDNPLLLIIPS